MVLQCLLVQNHFVSSSNIQGAEISYQWFSQAVILQTCADQIALGTDTGKLRLS